MKDLSETDYFRTVYEYIENLPAEQKAGGEPVAVRLENAVPVIIS